MGWGVAATIAGGAVSLLMLALHLTTADRPLSVLVAQEWLGRGSSTVWLYPAVGAVQLAYGALCGALLAVVAAPITLGSALGLATLRWFFTGGLLLPALGWGDFGLLRSPWLWLATMLPQLAYALTLGTVLHQEDEGREPTLLHPSQWHILHPRQWHFAHAHSRRHR